MTSSWRVLLAVTWTSWLLVGTCLGVDKRPNIVIIMADDMGFDDVSFRGSNEFLTPNIDSLAYNGLIIDRYYVPAMCTPSRAALMTGKHPVNLGMQHYVIPNDEPWGLPLTEVTMAQVFKDAGYYTSLLGKWHLGFARKAYTPLLRGFDYHYGYLGAFVDYYDQTLYSAKPYARGHDFRINLNSTRENIGKYVTDSLTEDAVRLITTHNTTKPLLLILSHLAPHTGNADKPLQAPRETVKKFHYIADHNRRKYAAMVSKLDDSVGQVVDSLKTKGILDNTIILFYSDNGAPYIGMHANNGSNYPLRGQKNSPWEGGIRTPAVIWSTQLAARGQIFQQTTHVMDWLPTLASAAGIDLNAELKVDGWDLWQQMKAFGSPVPRKLLHNIDDIFRYVAYTSEQWKYVNGTTNSGQYDGWLRNRDLVHIDPRSKHYADIVKQSQVWRSLAQFRPRHLEDIDSMRDRAAVSCPPIPDAKPCRPLEAECLFNIQQDPCEQNNVYDLGVLERIRKEVEEFRRNAKTPVRLPTDPMCNPRFYGFEWTWWKDSQP